MKAKPLYEVRQISDLKDMLNQSYELYSDRTAFLVKRKGGEDEYQPISYQQLKEDVDGLGTALIDLGLKNKRIAIIGENRYEWAVSYLGVVNGTGVVVPIDKELPEHEIENLLKRSEASAIIFSGKYEEIMKRLSEKELGLERFINMDTSGNDEFLSFNEVIKKGKELIKNGDKEFIDAKINNQEMNIMLFTSGTTDLAKAVMLSHKNICANLMDMCSMTYIGSDDIFLSFLPLHHTYECSCGFLTPIYRGAAIAYCEGMRHILKNLKESRATIMLSVPLLFESMYKRIWDQAGKKTGKVTVMKTALKVSNFLKSFGIDVRRQVFKELHEMMGGHLRLFVSGAAGIDPVVGKGFRDFGICFIQGYGLTECSPIAALNRDVWFKDEAAGLPLPHSEIRIDSPSADGIGEIVTKGPNVMLGYYDNKEATQNVLKDGWFYTGDLGYLDKDGFLHITGRKKNVIVTKNGKNIFPEELETLINRSPYIKESMVWGKPEADGDTMVCATVVMDKDYIQEKYPKELTENEIHDIIEQEIKAVNKKLTLYKHIREFKVRENEFIKTTTKKVKRHLELEEK